MKVHIDPRTNVLYASLFIYGLYKIFGEKNVFFSKKAFEDLRQENGVEDFDHYFAFIVVDKSKILKKVVIDFRDKNTINEAALFWSDVYGKVNYKKELLENSLNRTDFYKIVPIGPNFGIKLWNNFKSIKIFLSNYFATRKVLPVSIFRFFFSYFLQMRRAKIIEFQPKSAEENYIYFISSLRVNDRNNGETIKFRSLFINECKRSSNHFEGGLYSKKSAPLTIPKEILINKSISHSTYIKKIQKSNLVFNTPAVWGCHGWKLGEYLAMGKAIISTPLSNDMPSPFLHGIHVHFISNEEELHSAISKILNDKNYRKKLERGALSYYKNVIQADVVLMELINRS